VRHRACWSVRPAQARGGRRGSDTPASVPASRRRDESASGRRDTSTASSRDFKQERNSKSRQEDDYPSGARLPDGSTSVGSGRSDAVQKCAQVTQANEATRVSNGHASSSQRTFPVSQRGQGGVGAVTALTPCAASAAAMPCSGCSGTRSRDTRPVGRFQRSSRLRGRGDEGRRAWRRVHASARSDGNGIRPVPAVSFCTVLRLTWS
jgi:hypothetical protein